MTRLTLTRSVVGTAVAATLILGTAFAGGALADEAPMMLAAAAPAVTSADLDRPLVTSDSRDEERIRSLHDRLGITSSQEGVWGQLAQVMRTNDDKMEVLSTARHDLSPKMTAVEDLRSYGEITEAHAAGIRAFTPAFETLYNTMTPTQKANADNIFRHTGTKGAKKTT